MSAMLPFTYSTQTFLWEDAYVCDAPIHVFNADVFVGRCRAYEHTRHLGKCLRPDASGNSLCINMGGLTDEKAWVKNRL
jgi:hypothetical protein